MAARPCAQRTHAKPRQALGHFPAGTEWVQPNIDEAATLLQSLCTDPDARQRLGAAARQQIQHYNAASESAHRVPQQATHVAQPMPTATHDWQTACSAQ